MNKVKLMQGDNIESLKKLPENSIDSIVTDPPYGLSFMGKKWDYDVPSVEFWKEVLRVLKPGGHVLSFGGTRTYHRMVVNIEDAGFEIRDQVMWLYGSGFPKSHNIGKAVDKIQGNEREVFEVRTPGQRLQDCLLRKKHHLFLHSGLSSGSSVHNSGGYNLGSQEPVEITKGQSKYEGWGTALKPANEPICVARKPISEKTIAENVLKWGTGGINIDGCRVGTETIMTNMKNTKGGLYNLGNEDRTNEVENTFNEGRFPANIILDEEVGRVLDEQTGPTSQGHWPKGKTKGFGEFGGGETTYEGVGPKDKNKDKGGASRFFYCPKVGKKERNMGLDGFEDKQRHMNLSSVVSDSKLPAKNNHPTLKPINLMTYLCRLVTPVGGIVLDPFMGSGSTGIAARLEGFRFCGMEMDIDYFKISESRIENFEKYREFIK